MTNITRAKTAFTGTVKEIITLFLPLAFITFSGNLLFFVEKLFYVRLSVETMEVAVSVAYVSRIFQIPCTVLAMMAQVFVGRLQGAGREAAIGSYVWQFIWFAILSIFVITPLSLFYGMFYFGGTGLEDSAQPYFIFLVLINFLYPLGSSLSCFHLGRGRTRFILCATLAVHILNLILAYILILGVDGWIPSMGLIGGALSTLIAQGGFCFILFCDFISARNAKTYGSHAWRFQPKLFRECISTGLFRALNAMSVFLCWTFIAHLMIDKQGDYLLIWSLGSMIGLFLPFIGNAICQALTTITSNIVGAESIQLLRGVSLSGHFVILTIVGLMAIPMLLFPESLFLCLYPNITVVGSSVKNMFLGLWLSFTFGTLSYIPISRILAFKDTKFLLLTGSCCWLNGFLVMYLALNIFTVPADQCWIVLSFTNLFDLLLFSWRAKFLSSQKMLSKNVVANLMAF